MIIVIILKINAPPGKISYKQYRNIRKKLHKFIFIISALWLKMLFTWNPYASKGNTQFILVSQKWHFLTETCRCKKKFSTNWSQYKPYSNVSKDGRPGYIIPIMIKNMVSYCCGPCKEHGQSEVDFHFDGYGKKAEKQSLQEVSHIVFFTRTLSKFTPYSLFIWQYKCLCFLNCLYYDHEYMAGIFSYQHREPNSTIIFSCFTSFIYSKFCSNLYR